MKDVKGRSINNPLRSEDVTSLNWVMPHLSKRVDKYLGAEKKIYSFTSS